MAAKTIDSICTAWSSTSQSFSTEQKLSQFYGLEHVAIDTNNFDGEVTQD